MLRRPALLRTRAANDNLELPRLGARRVPPLLLVGMIHPRGNPARRSQPFRPGLWPLLMLGFSGLVLTILCGAFLIELAAVGLLAAGISGFDLLRAHLRRRPVIAVVDRHLAG